MWNRPLPKDPPAGPPLSTGPKPFPPLNPPLLLFLVHPDQVRQRGVGGDIADPNPGTFCHRSIKTPNPHPSRQFQASRPASAAQHGQGRTARDPDGWLLSAALVEFTRYLGIQKKRVPEAESTYGSSRGQAESTQRSRELSRRRPLKQPLRSSPPFLDPSLSFCPSLDSASSQGVPGRAGLHLPGRRVFPELFLSHLERLDRSRRGPTHHHHRSRLQAPLATELARGESWKQWIFGCI